MTFEKKIAKVFNLNDETWLRHSNPWSVWTRFTVLLVIMLAFWSRVYIDWYVLLVVISFIWMFANPHLFKKPKTTKHWTSKAVLGERVFINRDEIDIPAHHKLAPHLLNGIAGVGFFISIYSIVVLSVPLAIIGILFTYLGKAWYLDRMVWLYDEMKHLPEYKKWDY